MLFLAKYFLISKLFLLEKFMKGAQNPPLLMASLMTLKKETLASQTKQRWPLQNR